MALALTHARGALALLAAALAGCDAGAAPSSCRAWPGGASSCTREHRTART